MRHVVVDQVQNGFPFLHGEDEGKHTIADVFLDDFELQQLERVLADRVQFDWPAHVVLLISRQRLRLRLHPKMLPAVSWRRSNALDVPPDYIGPNTRAISVCVTGPIGLHRVIPDAHL